MHVCVCVRARVHCGPQCCAHTLYAVYITLKCLHNELLAITSLQKPLLHLIIMIMTVLKPALLVVMAPLPGSSALTIQGTQGGKSPSPQK